MEQLIKVKPDAEEFSQLYKLAKLRLALHGGIWGQLREIFRLRVREDEMAVTRLGRTIVDARNS